MNRAVTARQPEARASLPAVYQTLGYEVIPFRKTEDAVLAHVPTDVRLTVTAFRATSRARTEAQVVVI